VNILIRGPSLTASMSKYLIDRIEATANIEVHTHTELTQFHGDPATGLSAISWRCADTGVEDELPMRHVFLFVGAEPETRWLANCGVMLDAHGFVQTGLQLSDGTPRALLESSVQGVYAVGDVRAGSVKRVGGAIGEGANAVAMIHAFLAGTA
jgi:thioredoxin reductase (NADPH)